MIIRISRAGPLYIYYISSHPCSLVALYSIMQVSTNDSIFKGNAGVALESESVTWTAIVASLSYALAVHLIQVIIFLIIRPKLPKI
jgi:hypothetical protein